MTCELETAALFAALWGGWMIGFITAALLSANARRRPRQH